MLLLIWLNFSLKLISFFCGIYKIVIFKKLTCRVGFNITSYFNLDKRSYENKKDTGKKGQALKTYIKEKNEKDRDLN